MSEFPPQELPKLPGFDPLSFVIPMLPAEGPLGSYIQQIKKKPLRLRFAGYALTKVNGRTTTRQSTNETATEFQFYPLLWVSPDVSGSYVIEWMWQNGGEFGGSSAHTAGGTPAIGDVVNTFPGLVAGVVSQLKLVDNRDVSFGRDLAANGSEEIGDKEFIALGKQDGNWHVWGTLCKAIVKSPSGAVTATIQGQLPNENFKSAGALEASFAGYAVTKI
jgi:hypothetical protein